MNIKNNSITFYDGVSIDFEDVELIYKYKWHVDTHNYLVTYINKKKVYFHRLIMKAELNETTDHINRNPLDNRRQNLRLITYSFNEFNKRLQSNNLSGYRGITKCNTRNKWRSYITKNGKQTHLGYYDSIEDALKARLEAEILHYGENP